MAGRSQDPTRLPWTQPGDDAHLPVTRQPTPSDGSLSDTQKSTPSRPPTMDQQKADKDDMPTLSELRPQDTKPSAMMHELIDLRIISLEQWESAVMALEDCSNESILAFLHQTNANWQLDSSQVIPAITDYQLKKIQAGKAASLRIEHHVILDRLGVGGMGEVYQARSLNLSRIEAIKTIRTKDAANLQGTAARARFQREAKILATLRHPAITTIYHANHHKDVAYIVMEYVDGEDMDSIVRKAQAVGESVPVWWAVDCVIAVAEALHDAHRHDIIHRDVKPSNIMITSDGALKVLDMGIAKLVTPEGNRGNTVALTINKSGLGTPQVMPPEQWADATDVKPASDIYSLACTFYYMLTGQMPYEGKDVRDIMMAHVSQPPPAVSDARPDVPKALDAIIQKMLAKRPEDRYQTAMAVADALRPFAKKAPPPPWPAGKVVAVAAGLVLGLLLAVVGVKLVTDQGSGDRLEQLIAAVNKDPSNADVHFELGQHYARLNRPADARDAFNRAVELDPKKQNYRVARADASYRLGDDVDALADLRESLRLSTEGQEANRSRELLANVYTRLAEQRQSDAAALLEFYRQADEDGVSRVLAEPVARALLADAKRGFEEGDVSAAETAIAALLPPDELVRAPADARREAHGLRARINKSNADGLSDPTKKIELLESVVNDFRRASEGGSETTKEAYREELGDCYLQIAKLSSSGRTAYRYYENAAELLPKRFEVQSEYGKSAESLSNWGTAQQAYEAALELKPDSQQTLERLVHVCCQLETEVAKAVEYFEKLDAATLELIDELAEALEDAEDFESAARYYNVALGKAIKENLPKESVDKYRRASILQAQRLLGLAKKRGDLELVNLYTSELEKLDPKQRVENVAPTMITERKLNEEKEHAEELIAKQDFNAAVDKLRALRSKLTGDEHKDEKIWAEVKLSKTLETRADQRLRVDSPSEDAFKLTVNDLKEARDLAVAKRVLTSKLVDAYVRWGDWLRGEKKDLRAALDHYDQAIELDSDSFAAFDGRARIFERMGNLDRAIQEYRMAELSTDNDEEKTRCRTERGNLLAKKGDVYTAKKQFAAAADEYEKALAVDDKPPAELKQRAAKVFLAKAVHEMENDNRTDAKQSARRARELNPQDPRVHVVLGNVEIAENRTKEAVSHYRDALRLDPKNVEWKLRLADLIAATANTAFNANNFKEAEAKYVEAAQLNPGKADEYNRRAMQSRVAFVESTLPSFDEGLEHLEAAEKIYPAGADDVNRVRAVLYDREGDRLWSNNVAKAIESYLKAAKLTPDEAASQKYSRKAGEKYASLAHAFYQEGQKAWNTKNYKEAGKQFNNAVMNFELAVSTAESLKSNYFPWAASACSYLGHSRESQGDRQAAYQAFDDAVEKFEATDPAYIVLRGVAAFKWAEVVSDVKQREKLFQRTLADLKDRTLEKKDHLAMYYRGFVNAYFKNYAEAESDLRQAISANQSNPAYYDCLASAMLNRYDADTDAGKLDEATEFAKKACELNDKQSEYFWTRARIHWKLAQWEEAKRVIALAVEKAGTNANKEKLEFEAKSIEQEKPYTQN